MGTNYYLANNGLRVHLGKRSSAGMYCWDCDLTLCKGGNTEIHEGRCEWFDRCPKCGRKVEEENIEDSSTGRELGFNRKPFGKKTGVKSASNFTWAIDPAKVYYFSDDVKIQDEYDRNLTLQEFRDMLRECPLHFYGLIGKEFC